MMWLAIFLAGLIFGSFAAAMAYRLPRGLPLVLDRSRCPHCRRPLGVLDLIPLLSWLTLKGRCRYCQGAIGCRYPIVEFSSGVLFLLVWRLAGGDGLRQVCLCGLVVGLQIIVLVDLEWRIIPDRVLLCLLPLVLVLRWQDGDWLDGLAGGLAGLAATWLVAEFFRRWRGRDGLGLGDVKFFALAGLAVGLSGLGAYLLVTSLLGILFGLAWRASGRQAAFPLAPALASGLLLILALPDLPYFFV